MKRGALIAALLLAACTSELDLSPERFACDAGGACPSFDARLSDLGVTIDTGVRIDATTPDAATADADGATPDSGPIEAGVCITGPNGFWRRITDNVGEARSGHSMVWDALASRSVIFGGSGADNRVMAMSFGALNLFELIPRGAERGTAMRNHSGAITFDRRLIVFGGRSSTGNLLAETWSFDLTGLDDPSWDRALDASHGVEGHPAAIGDRMYVPGGCVPAPSPEVGSLNLTLGTWLTENVSDPEPAGRCEHSAVLAPATTRIVVFGGRSPAVLDETWIFDFDPSEWSRAPIQGPAPPARYGHTAVVEPFSNRMLVFGGIGADGQPRNDLWALSFNRWCWEQLRSGATPRSEHAAVWANERMFIYGGENGGVLSDVWELTF